LSLSQVFFNVVIAAFSLGQAFPNLENLLTAAGAAVAIFEIIARVRVAKSWLERSLLTSRTKTLTDPLSSPLSNPPLMPPQTKALSQRSLRVPFSSTMSASATLPDLT